MTLTGIDAFLRENDLAFLGFEIWGDALHAYKRRFPDDRAATHLGRWQVFENENPDTFIGITSSGFRRRAKPPDPNISYSGAG